MLKRPTEHSSFSEEDELNKMEVIFSETKLELPYDNITGAIEYHQNGRTQNILPSLSELSERGTIGFGGDCVDFARLLSAKLTEAGYPSQDLRILSSQPSEDQDKIHASIFQNHPDGLYYHDPTILPYPVLVPEEGVVQFEYAVGNYENECIIKRVGDRLEIQMISMVGQILFDYKFDLSGKHLGESQLNQITLHNIRHLIFFRLLQFKGVEGQIEIEHPMVNIGITSGLQPSAERQMQQYLDHYKIPEAHALMMNFRQTYQAIFSERR